MKEILDKWLDVQFIQNGNNKFGCDCLGLILGFYKDLKMNNLLLELDSFIVKLRSINNLNYILNNELFREIIEKFYYKINKNNLQIGDILIFFSKAFPIHFGIYYEKETFLEANGIFKKVILNKLKNYENYICLNLKKLD